MSAFRVRPSVGRIFVTLRAKCLRSPGPIWLSMRDGSSLRLEPTTDDVTIARW